MEPGFDAAVAETAKHVAWRVGDLRMFDDPEQQELLEVARRLRVAGVVATAVPPLDGSLTRTCWISCFQVCFTRAARAAYRPTRPTMP